MKLLAGDKELESPFLLSGDKADLIWLAEQILFAIGTGSKPTLGDQHGYAVVNVCTDDDYQQRLAEWKLRDEAATLRQADEIRARREANGG